MTTYNKSTGSDAFFKKCSLLLKKRSERIYEQPGTLMHITETSSAEIFTKNDRYTCDKITMSLIIFS